MNYSEASLKPRSEKIILAIAEAVDQYKIWTLHSGSVYKRTVEHFVFAVKEELTALTLHTSTSLSVGQYYFDAKNLTLYVRMSDSSNPKTKNVSATYRFFYSNAPFNLPCDLASGETVEFLPVISSIGSLGQQLDDQNTGIVLESSSTISMVNSDGYFDEIFDAYIWENQNIYFYSWMPEIPLSEAQKIFEGVIESKDFSVSQVTFKVKDFVFKLKNQVTLPLFSEDDGEVAPSIIGTPKRRIYGQVKQLKCTGIDNVLNGYPLTGTITAAFDSVAMTGVGTSFLDELSPGDELFVTINEELVKIGVESVESDTALTLSRETENNINALTATVLPSVPWRKKNREWHIAGHKLRDVQEEITEVTAGNRVTMASVQDYFAEDSVEVNGQFVNIRRISDNKIVFKTNLAVLPFVTDIVRKNPVQNVYLGDKKLAILRDFTISNTTEAKIILDELAEFNIVEPRSMGVNLTFTNASRSITTVAAVDLRSILKPRDWIRKVHASEADWYEILSVSEQSITIRTPFIGTTQTTSGLRKNVNVAVDDSLVTVDCLGIEVDGEWIRTPSQAVRHLVLNDAEFSSVNETAFDKAKADCDYTLSLFIPENIGQKAPSIKDVITKINESVFGSLYGNSSWAISYSILNSQKPEFSDVLKDDDILSFDVVSDQKIVNAVKVNYRPFTDIYTGNEGFEVYSQESDFVNRLIGIKNTEERTIYLYDEDKAKIIAQRLLFFGSMSSCKVQVKAKLNLALTSVNDKIFLELDRLYKRYGGRDRRKIGVVTSVKKNGMDTDVEFTDLGNIFNRIPSIAPNTALAYASAERNDIVRWGYLLDNDTLTPDVLSEAEFGNNLIG